MGDTNSPVARAPSALLSNPHLAAILSFAVGQSKGQPQQMRAATKFQGKAQGRVGIGGTKGQRASSVTQSSMDNSQLYCFSQ